MRVTIHQPTFLPYLGFFRKIAMSDIFVVYDTAQYSRGDWHNRNRILGPNGVLWLTVPMRAGLHDSFRSATLADTAFVRKHLAAISHAYERSPYFHSIYPALKKLYLSPSSSLAEHNWKFIGFFLKLLGLNPKIVWSHDIPGMEEKHSTAAIAHIAGYLGAESYVSGTDGPNYMDMNLLADKGIRVELNDYSARPYPQLWTDKHVPHLSVIDALMNVGPEGVRKLIGL